MSRMGAQNSLLDSTETIAVPITTIDDYCARTGLEPDWILIDIEGFELAALRGAARTSNAIAGVSASSWKSTRRSGFRWRHSRRRRSFPAEQWIARRTLDAQGHPLGEYGLVHLSWT